MSTSLIAPWCGVHLQKPIFRKISTFYGSPTFIALPSRAQQWYLSEPNEAIQHGAIQILYYVFLSVHTLILEVGLYFRLSDQKF
jgi:hypothetical protein